MPDPITVIVSVLAAGAAAAGNEMVSQVVKDAYNGFKAFIVSKFESKPDVAASLQFLEKKPASSDFQEAVEQALREAGADQDDEIRTQTEELRTLLEKEKLLSQNFYQGKVEGSGALAQGKDAIAVGEGGIAIGGNVTGNVTTGEK